MSTFFFTTEQGKDIIVQDSLLSDTLSPTCDLSALYNDLNKLSEKDKKLELHSITLSDYWRQEIIPRGLRIKKFPSFVSDNADFKRKWEAILNKCSLDLILLLIEEAKTQRSQVQAQMDEIRQTIAHKEASADQKDTLEKKLQEDINRLSRSLKQIKMDKFRRDQNDYKEGLVYSWHSRTPRRTRQERARTVSFSLPSSGEEDFSSDSTAHATDFLDKRTSTKTPRRRERRGEAEGGGGRFNRSHSPDSRYPLRTRHHRTNTTWTTNKRS